MTPYRFALDLELRTSSKTHYLLTSHVQYSSAASCVKFGIFLGKFPTTTTKTEQRSSCATTHPTLGLTFSPTVQSEKSTRPVRPPARGKIVSPPSSTSLKYLPGGKPGVQRATPWSPVALATARHSPPRVPTPRPSRNHGRKTIIPPKRNRKDPFTNYLALMYSLSNHPSYYDLQRQRPPRNQMSPQMMTHSTDRELIQSNACENGPRS